MFLLVRDEDGPTVASAINAFADEEGLEPIDLEGTAQNPLAMLSVLTGPRVLVAHAESGVAVFGLESLDIADPEEWGSEISAACETEVIALEVVAHGVRVHVYDGGEEDEVLDVEVDPSGRTRCAPLADLVDGDLGRRELEEGIVAKTSIDLATGILRCFGVTGPSDESITLSFVDPLDEDEEATPHLDVAPLADLPDDEGGVVQSFAVTLRGKEAVEGLRLEVSGSALGLVAIREIEATGRAKGSSEPMTRASAPGEVTLDLPDALLERVDVAPPTFDMSDLFSTMQRLVGAGDAQQRNTLFVTVRATRTGRGKGALVLAARARDEAVVAGEATAVLEL